MQMLMLGLLFILCTFIVFSACALFSGQIGEFLKKRESGAGILNKVAGSVLMGGLGVALALSKR